MKNLKNSQENLECIMHKILKQTAYKMQNQTKNMKISENMYIAKHHRIKPF